MVHPVGHIRKNLDALTEADCRELIRGKEIMRGIYKNVAFTVLNLHAVGMPCSRIMKEALMQGEPHERGLPPSCAEAGWSIIETSKRFGVPDVGPKKSYQLRVPSEQLPRDVSAAELFAWFQHEDYASALSDLKVRGRR